MPATMTKRDEAILEAYAQNERLGELDQILAGLGDTANPIVADLARVADSLNFQLRETIMELVRKNLGPQEQDNLMLVLRKAGEWLEAERAELRVAPSRNAQRLRELDDFEMYLRDMARDILRIMADHNFQRSQ